MSLITSPELFINMKSYPKTKDSQEFKPFWEYEKEKCLNGVYINGVYMHGWLYWHLNHWAIDKTIEGKYGTEFLTSHPDLRDNEWIISEGLTRAEAEKQAFCIVGLRQMGKTTLAASYTARSATFYKKSQNIIAGASETDLNSITFALDTGIANCTPQFRVKRITKDWTAKEVLLGKKTSDNDNEVHSIFRIRNTQEGRKTEVVAGATNIKSLIIDEIGKGNWLQVYEAAKPALKSEHGWRCIPILTGTGGAFEKGKQAEIAFFNPESNDILAFADEYGKKTGFFMSGLYRQDCKKLMTLSEFLGIEEPSELDTIPIKVSDKEKAREVISEERKKKEKNPDQSIYLKEIMYYPLTPEECFLSEGANIFPKELLLEQKKLLMGKDDLFTCVELYRDADGEVKHKFTTKKPILNYPSKPEDNREGVVQIWEFPMHGVSNLYVAGTDPYKQGQAKYSDSVGSTYIYKRFYNPLEDKFQDMIVAAYHGRPKKLTDFYQTTAMLLDFYKAKTLCENEDIGFIQHYSDKQQAYRYFVEQPAWLKDIIPNTTVERGYGIHAHQKIIAYMNSLIQQYLVETIDKKVAEDGTTTETLGVRRILDPLLIEELIKYDGDMNADRVRSFGLTLMYAHFTTKRQPASMNAVDNRLKSLKDNYKKNKSPFSTRVNHF